MGDRILVVDDDPDILQYVKMNLELEGFETAIASNGVDALQLASENPPALVLLDVMMPGMDGLTTLRHLRNDPPTASVPVVMLTARALAQDRVKGLDLGADDYITKPFAVEELVARVRTVIRRAQHPPQPAKSGVGLRESGVGHERDERHHQPDSDRLESRRDNERSQQEQGLRPLLALE